MAGFQLLEERVFLGLGSNLGDRESFLAGGLRGLSQRGFRIAAVSPVMESPPLGRLEQPPFLNLVVEGRWEGTPQVLLNVIRGVEEKAGRSRPFPHAPRTLDVDLILFGARIVLDRDLRVPHPQWKNRSFVVQPLSRIAPEMVDPESGLRVREIERLWAQEPKMIRFAGDGDLLLPGIP